MYFTGSEWVKYAGPIVHLYWKAEGSNEWILLRCDADYLSIVITVKDIFGMKRQILYLLSPKVGNKNSYDYIYNR